MIGAVLVKHVAVWKVILFTILSLGIYVPVWAARQRASLQEANVDGADKIPAAWSVLLVPYILATAGSLIVSFILFLLAIFRRIPADLSYDMSIAAMVLAILAHIGLGIWWFVVYGKAVRQLTHGRIPTAWTVVLFLASGGFIIAFYQFYINKSLNKKLHDSGVTIGFIAVAVAVIVVSLLLNVYFSLDTASTRDETIRGIEDTARSIQVTEQYTSCVEEAASRYPNLYTDQAESDAYNNSLAQCDEIYQQIPN